MNQSSVPISLILKPLPIILGSILPNLLPVPILLAVEQLTGVNGAITQSDGPESLPLR